MNLLRHILNYKYTLVLFLFFVIVWLCLWVFCISIIPASPLGGPDEGLRYLVPKFIFETGQLPTGYDTATIHSMGNWSYAFYPQFLGPLFSAGFMSFVSVFSSTPDNLIYAARMTSVLFGTLTVLFVGKTVEKLYKSSENGKVFSYLAMMLFVAWPQVAFLSAYVNNDIVGLCGVSIILYACMAGYKDQWNGRNATFLALGFIICLLGYINSYGFVLFGGLFFVISLWWQVNSKAKFFKLFSTVALMTLLLAGPFFLRNAVLYSGDVFGLSSFREETQEWERDSGKEAQRSYEEQTGQGIISLIRSEAYRETQTESAIARFGKMTIAPEEKYMNIYKYFIWIGVLGCIWFCASKWLRYIRNQKKSKKFVMMLGQGGLLIISVAAACVVTVALSLYYSLFIDYQAQGRYIIYLLVPLVVAVFHGWMFIIERIIVKKYQFFIVSLLMSVYLITTLIIYYKYIFALKVI